MTVVTPRVMAWVGLEAASSNATRRAVSTFFAGTVSRQSPFSSYSRVFSTEAAVVAAATDDLLERRRRPPQDNDHVPPVTTTTTTKTTTTTTTTTTPKRQRRAGASRLKDLRELLQREDEEHGTKRSLSWTKNGSCGTTREAAEVTSPVASQSAETPPPALLNGQMLTDSFGRRHSYLRISLVEKCNLRCQYCMPPDGLPHVHSPDQLLSAPEIVTLARLFVEAGVNKIRLTGGEPLLRDPADVLDIVSQLAPQVESLGMTTNGLLVPRHFHSLVEAGLTHLNISLDTLRPARFLEVTRRRGLDRVWQALELASSHEAFGGQPPGRLKLNCVVMRHFNDDEMADFVELTRHRVLDVRFIEWMPFLDNGWSRNRLVPYHEMKRRILQHFPNLQRLDDGPHDTTKWWGVPGYQGRIGFITSMSQHFCGTCNRLRLTANGTLKACLFGAAETNLRDALRHPNGGDAASLPQLIETAVKQKTFALGGHGTADAIAKANDNRPMTTIGG